MFLRGSGHVRDTDAVADITVYDPKNDCISVYYSIGEVSQELNRQSDDTYRVSGFTIEKPLYIIGMPFSLEYLTIVKRTDKPVIIEWQAIRLSSQERRKWARMNKPIVYEHSNFRCLYENGYAQYLPI
jgi:hypothetical protein